MTKRIDFQTDPSRYRHWRVAYDGDVATLFMDVDEKGGLFEGYSSSSIPTISASISNSPTSCSACASSIRKSGASCCARARTASSARAPTSACSASATPRAQGEFLQVHQRDAQHLRGRGRRSPASTTSARSRAPARAAATSWRWPATTSSSPTTARPPWRCRRCRCWRCCRAPAASRA